VQAVGRELSAQAQQLLAEPEMGHGIRSDEQLETVRVPGESGSPPRDVTFAESIAYPGQPFRHGGQRVGACADSRVK